MAIQSEAIAGKCARLLKASRSPPVSNLSVDWGLRVDWDLATPSDLNDDFEMVEPETATLVETTPTKSKKRAAPINLFDDSHDPLAPSQDIGAKPAPEVILTPRPFIEQAPLKVPNLYPGNRFIISAIVTSKLKKIPENVAISGELPSGQKLELKVPVQKAIVTTTPPLIHTLAAKRLIQDLEDGNVKPKAVNQDKVSEEDIVKAAVVRLGSEYQLTSRYTSFIAVDQSLKKDIPLDESYKVAVKVEGGYTSNSSMEGAKMSRSKRSHSPPSPSGMFSPSDISVSNSR